MPLLACSVPIATLTGVLTGALQGRERFLETNVISVLSTTLFQLLPLSIALFVGPNLTALLAAAVLSRIIALGVLAVRSYMVVGYAAPLRFQRSEATQLLRYGGWVSLTSVFGPLLVIVDRFALGAIVGAAAVAAYTVPFQLAQRIAILPSSLTNALFPRMSAADEGERVQLAHKATLTLVCLLSPPIMVFLILLQPFLKVWVGPEIAGTAGPAGRVLVIGFWANAFALVPFMRLQASGRPDLVTKLLIAQVPPYLALLFLAMKSLGMIGCAIVFTVRCGVDLILQSLAAGRRVDSALLIFINLVLVLGAALVPISTPVWWLAAAALVMASVTLNLTFLPADLRAGAIQRLRRAIPGATA
jgi:O-antigen/teichoic acid export membrane protein